MAEAAFLVVGKSVVSKLADLVAQEISLACSAKQELKKLEDSLGAIKKTQAFEEGQYVRTSPTNDRLEELKDAAYDAEDVLDEFATEVSRQRMEKICFGTLDEVWEFCSRLLYYFKLGHQIREIRERLKNIEIDENHFNRLAHPISRTSVVNNETSPFLSNPSSVIGRNEEKDKIVELLMEFERDNAQNVLVIPIVGMGGVGKTTLARFVFNDERVKKHFDLRIWVYVSDDFAAKKIAERIIEDITGKGCDDLQVGVVQRLLGEQLDGKRYLLVLDDVWNEDDDKWVPVKELFQGAKEGSRILVTTRSNQVASIMSPTSTHLLLGPLSNDIDSWSVFKQRAFSEGEEETYKTTLVPIGREIVRKCGGVPLAITALGSLLKSETDESYWEFVRDNDIWKLTEEVNRNERKGIDIMPILKFSYYHLPPHLKACFAYCSLFPKDHEIVRETLILLWMANGLILPSTRPMEDVGNEYFQILLSRSFFQDAKKDDDGTIISCKMHDLMHDLAQDITPPRGSSRHIWLSDELNPQLFNIASKSRTLIKPGRLKLPCGTCLSFKRLRALDLSWSNLRGLPDSICELKHLRYLDLSSSYIVALPDSFSRLQNLQTLIVRECKNLEELPKDTWKMVKLRHIINVRTPLTHMPSGLGQLSSLRTLSKFVVGDKIGSKISELGPLNGLRDDLCILSLNHVTDPADAVKASLEKKQNLNFLNLIWDMEQIRPRQRHDEDILGRLHPPTNLKKIAIDGYAGVKFPNWRMSTLERLVSITLSNFSGCDDLSALGDLPCLRFLYLRSMPHLECISGGLQNLVSLEDLSIHDCPMITSLPISQYITNLSLRYCPNATWLEQEADESLTGFRSLQKLSIVSLPKVVSLPNVLQHSTSLQYLDISSCDGLTIIPEWLPNLTSLQELYLSGCPLLTSLPEGMQRLTRLQFLTIRACPRLYGRCQPETGEDWAKIAHVPNRIIKEVKPGILQRLIGLR